MTGIVLSSEYKSIPPDAWTVKADDYLAFPRGLDEFQTPLLTLDHGALSHNVAVMFEWLRQSDLLIAPHGKTTMAPELWHDLQAAGAWGMTFATAWQMQRAYSLGFNRLMLANTLVDPVGLRWLGAALDADPDFEAICWVDSLETVERMEAVLHAASVKRLLPVIIELGASGGRTGSRSIGEALHIADRVRRSDRMQVAGVGGYEGSLAHDRSAGGLKAVDAYLDQIVRLNSEINDAGHYEGHIPIVTAGGSAYFDRVAARFTGIKSEAVVLLRAGAFQIHDDGFYDAISPMGSIVGSSPFRSAMHAWVRVVSRPEPDLALFDAGKRDLPFDEGLPRAQRVCGLGADESAALLSGSVVTALNDQHGFLRLSENAVCSGAAGETVLPIGSVVRLGLSHPCTALDKWRLLPVLDDADSAHPRVIRFVETWF